MLLYSELEWCQFLLSTIYTDESVSLPYIKELKGMPPGLPSSLHTGKVSGVVHILILYRGSGCSVTSERPNANVLQQVAAFPQERRKNSSYLMQNWFWFYSFSLMWLNNRGKRSRDLEPWKRGSGLTSWTQPHSHWLWVPQELPLGSLVCSDPTPSVGGEGAPVWGSEGALSKRPQGGAEFTPKHRFRTEQEYPPVYCEGGCLIADVPPSSLQICKAAF